MSTTTNTQSQLWDIADSLRSLALVIDLVSTDTLDSEYPPRGTIVKAKPDQSRFKLKSMWVSLGDGKYKHLTGKKGLITTHDRLADYTDVVFQA